MITPRTSSDQLETFAFELINRMNDQVRQLTREISEEITLCQKAVQVAYQAIEELKIFMLAHPFKSIKEEIIFFRRLKPTINSQYKYFQKRLDIALNEPFLEAERKEYRESHLLKIQAFRQQHNEFYTYCISSQSCFDEQYFSRQSTFQNPDYDRNFSTGYDALYAELLANDELKNFLITHLQKATECHDQSSLIWTAPKAALIELIYALKATEAFNEGKVDLKQITTTFENLFHIKLGNYSRVYQDIRLRKSGQANFLVLLKEKFLSRISDLD
jgi:hypothetical protein